MLPKIVLPVSKCLLLQEMATILLAANIGQIPSTRYQSSKYYALACIYVDMLPALSYDLIR